MLGWPVAHSRSPTIQNAALRAAGLSDWRYQLLPVPPELFAELVRALPDAGFRGVNVTIPHKPAALALATRPTERAESIGAANTLVFESDDGVVADNTDAPALIGALGLELAGASALVLGAGGTARAAVWALNHAGAETRVWNRTPERARALCAELGGTPVNGGEPADLLVNCTSVGLDGSDSFDGLGLARPIWRASGPWSTSSTAAPARPSSERPPSSAYQPSTGSSCWSGRARSASSCSPAGPRRSRRCARRSGAGVAPHGGPDKVVADDLRRCRH